MTGESCLFGKSKEPGSPAQAPPFEDGDPHGKRHCSSRNVSYRQQLVDMVGWEVCQFKAGAQSAAFLHWVPTAPCLLFGALPPKHHQGYDLLYG